jgi:hypothetical protein
MIENKPQVQIKNKKRGPASIKRTDEQSKKLDYFIAAPLRSANRLMKQLYEDDHFYETATYAWVGAEDAKKIFLYGTCKEVTKTCIGLMSDKEVLQEVPDKKEPDRISKIIAGSITDVQTYRIRKMVELLSLLILFDRNTKRDEEYRIYLSSENMDLVLARQEDFRELYGGRVISSTQRSIDSFAERIQRDMQELEITDLWFLDNAKLRRQKPSVFKGKKALYLAALLVANPDERLALGISYGRGYSRASQSVHPLLGSHDYGKEDNNTKKIITNFTYLSIISMHIMHLVYKLAGMDDPGDITRVLGANFEESEASQAIAKLKKEFQLGDIVLTAWTDLAKIVDVHTSKYGYKAYKVRYISRPPLPRVSEDWLEAQMVMARLMTKSMVRGFFEKSARSVSYDKEIIEAMQEVLALPEEELMRYSEKIFLDLHNAEILIPMLLQTGFLKKKDAPDF